MHVFVITEEWCLINICNTYSLSHHFIHFKSETCFGARDKFIGSLQKFRLAWQSLLGLRYEWKVKTTCMFYFLIIMKGHFMCYEVCENIWMGLYNRWRGKFGSFWSTEGICVWYVIDFLCYVIDCFCFLLFSLKNGNEAKWLLRVTFPVPTDNGSARNIPCLRCDKAVVLWKGTKRRLAAWEEVAT